MGMPTSSQTLVRGLSDSLLGGEHMAHTAHNGMLLGRPLRRQVYSFSGAAQCVYLCVQLHAWMDGR